MNKPIYLGLSVLDINKIAMYEYCNDYVKPEVWRQMQDCVTWIQSLIVYVKSEDVYEDLPEDVETRFNTSNYEVKRLQPIDQKSNWLMKGELDGKIMTEMVALRPKM